MIDVRDLSFRYHKRLDRVIDSFSHTFSPGEFTVVTGTSGSGKSTLLYLLGLMLTPESGDISIDSVNITQMNDAQRTRIRAEKIGFIFQDSLLDLSRSLIDNVREGCLFVDSSPTDAEIVALLQRFGVGQDPHRRPGESSGG